MLIQTEVQQARLVLRMGEFQPSPDLQARKYKLICKGHRPLAKTPCVVLYTRGRLLHISVLSRIGSACAESNQDPSIFAGHPDPNHNGPSSNYSENPPPQCDTTERSMIAAERILSGSSISWSHSSGLRPPMHTKLQQALCTRRRHTQSNLLSGPFRETLGPTVPSMLF